MSYIVNKYSSIHYHKCGLTFDLIEKKYIMDYDRGCGSVYYHTKDNNSHICPNCNRETDTLIYHKYIEYEIKSKEY